MRSVRLLGPPGVLASTSATNATNAASPWKIMSNSRILIARHPVRAVGIEVGGGVHVPVDAADHLVRAFQVAEPVGGVSGAKLGAVLMDERLEDAVDMRADGRAVGGAIVIGGGGCEGRCHQEYDKTFQHGGTSIVWKDVAKTGTRSKTILAVRGRRTTALENPRSAERVSA